MRGCKSCSVKVPCPSLRHSAHSGLAPCSPLPHTRGVILDLDKFIAKERFYWDELAALLERQDAQPDRRQSLEEAKRFYYLYQRTSSDLVKLNTFAGEA